MKIDCIYICFEALQTRIHWILKTNCSMMPEMHTYNPIIHQTKKQCPIVLCHPLSTLNSNQPLFRLTINNKSNYNSKVLNPQPYQAKDTIKQYPVIPEHNHGRYKLHWNHNVTDHRPSTYCILWCFLLFCFFKPRALMVRRLSKYKTVICGLRRYLYYHWNNTSLHTDHLAAHKLIWMFNNLPHIKAV